MKKNPRILLTLMALMCISVWSTLATAGTLEAYAVLDIDNDSCATLTFRYDAAKPERAYGIASGSEMAPAWSEKSSTISKVVFDSSFVLARPTTCYRWFEYFSKLTEIIGIENLNTSQVTNMSFMFEGCSSLTSLDVSHFDTRNVTDMSYMFMDCGLLTSLDVSHFNTEKVQNMRFMFYNCFNVGALDVSGFDTRNVTDMSRMFCYCVCIKSLDVSHFDTRKVTDMSYMFMNCSFTSLDVSRFSTRNVTDMSHMFDMCLWLKKIDLSSFDTQNVTNMSCMFYSCFSLSTAYVSDGFVTAAVTKDSEMFRECTVLKGAVSFDGENIGKNRANYVNGYFTKLVGTLGGEKIGATGEVLTATDSLTFSDEKDFVPREAFRAANLSYGRTLPSAGEWSTLCLPFKVDMNGQNFRAFTLLSATGTTVTLQELTTQIPAGTPAIIKMNDDAQDISLSYTDTEIVGSVADGSTTTGGDYGLMGVFAKKEFDKATDNHSFIQQGAYLMNPAKALEQSIHSTVELPAYHAYMQETVPLTSEAKMFSLEIDRVPTSVEEVEVAPATLKTEYFDLQGRRLNGLQKGFNIVKQGGKAIKIFLE